MDVGLLAVLITIYKAAEKTGLLDYLKSMPEKTLEALYEKFIQDHAAQNKFLKPLFTPKFEKAFDRALQAIAPVDTPLRKELFLLAILTEPAIINMQQNLHRGELPARALLMPVFQRVLGKNEVSHLVDSFVEGLYADISKNQEVVNLVLLTLAEKMSGQQRLLLEIRDKISANSSTIPQKEPFKIFTARLPTTSSTLFGREAELTLLDEAWADEHTHLLSLVAWGGVGKTALVNEWLSRLERDNYRGAERVFGWSFYSQGTREERNVSADSFFDEALRWFEYSGPAILSPWDKGIRLAELLRQQKTLLILDGVEPLQYPPGQLQGELKDQGLKALLKELARANLGLCVVTTRVALQDISHTEGKTSRRVYLENLSPEAGSQLLRHLQVKGTDKELAGASQEFGGHALALNLLGRYLAVVHDGEVRKRDLIPHLTEEEKQGGHARRVMESYERWLAGKPECDILHLMGLFDRPAAKGAIAVLLAKPEIKGLTSNLQNLPPAQLQFAFQHLRDLRLLAEKDAQRPDTLDCHPLVREHFGEKLRRQNPAAWQEAHSRLYEYYKNLPAKELPDTLEEMEPLFAAVAHGCQAGRHNEVFEKVFKKRLHRGSEFFSIHKLGLISSDLSALYNFFDSVWSKPIGELDEPDKAAVLNNAGFDLLAFGRLPEAIEATQASLDLYTSQKNIKRCSIVASNVSELFLTIGDIKQAIEFGNQSVKLADQAGDEESQIICRAILSDALFQSGSFEEAERIFSDAENIQKVWQPNFQILYSWRGFRYCSLLLHSRKYDDVIERIEQISSIQNKPWYNLLDSALDHLILAQAYLLELLQDDTTRNFSEVNRILEHAILGLRKAGQQIDLVRGLLARAACYRAQNEFALAWADLEEAREIAERGGMKLFLADYHLEVCRLCLAEGGGRRAEGMAQGAEGMAQGAEGKGQEAREHLDIVAKMIEEMGYGRRRPEVEELRQQLQSI